MDTEKSRSFEETMLLTGKRVLISIGLGVFFSLYVFGAGDALAAGAGPAGPASTGVSGPPVCQGNAAKAQSTYDKYKAEAIAAGKMVILPAMSNLMTCLTDFMGLNFSSGYISPLSIAQTLLNNIASAVCNEVVSAWDTAMSSLPSTSNYSWNGYPIYTSSMGLGSSTGTSSPIAGGSSGNMYGGSSSTSIGLPSTVNPFNSQSFQNAIGGTSVSGGQGYNAQITGPTVNPFGQ